MNKVVAEKLFTSLLLGLSCIFIAEYLISVAAWFFFADGLKDHSGTPLGADYLNVYAAGVLANTGRAALAYDWSAHKEIEQAVAGFPSPYFGWHYPPPFLLAAGIAACLPYLWSFVSYISLTFAAYFFTLAKLIPRSREYLFAVAAFPGAYINIINGQNGFITTTLFAGGLLALERSPWIAGAIFGFLVYKPQFFLLIPIVLLVSGLSRAFLASVLSAAVTCALSWLTYGTATWRAFLESAHATRTIILEQGSTGWEKIQSVFSATRILGGSLPLAYLIQVSVIVVSLGATIWVWRRCQDLAIRGSSLAFCLLLTTPYILDYDLVLLAVPLALLVSYGLRHSFEPYEKLFLCLLWILPLTVREIGSSGLPLTPPFLMTALGLCVVKAKRFSKTVSVS